jgi:hypothetical protein
MAQLSALSSVGVASLLLLLGGCAAQSAPHAPTDAADLEARSAGEPGLSGSSGSSLVREAPRRVGDRLVHRYSGTYRSEALVIAEEVVAQEGDVLVVDFTVLEGDAPQKLRVRMSVRSERVIAVSKIKEDSEHPASITDYERLMEKTAFSTERNRGLVSRRPETCLIGPAEFDCVRSEFDVQVAGKQGTLLVSRHPGLARDVAGEVTAVDGTIIYKADLIEFERGALGADTDAPVAFGETPAWAEK